MEIHADTKPIAIFEHWMKEAKAEPKIKEPTAMALATAKNVDDLHVRVVLCKGWSEDGFVFFTNYDSRKGQELKANANAAAVFYWDPLFRQVKVSGSVEPVSREQSVNYWRTRPRESQLSQYVSKQSKPISNRDLMDAEWKAAELKFADQEVPCPDHWGGYLLRPKTIEFWIGRPGRFHDRHEYKVQAKGWTYTRLYP
jgi:pyridoxamine 5'-phosphate oxidase